MRFIMEAIGIVVLIAVLVPATYIDIKKMVIPDAVTIGGFVLGVMYGFVIGDPMGALAGAFMGSGVLLWICVISEYILKKETLGFGDIKLMGCIGAFLGYKGALCAIFMGSLLGSLYFIPLLFLKKMKTGSRVPFGPWLALGAVVYALGFSRYFDQLFYLNM